MDKLNFPVENTAELPAASAPGAYEPIAIIGMDCRFPGSDGVEAYWDFLQSDRIAISEMPAERRRLTNFELGEGDHYRWGGFLPDIERFDAALFGISPREAHSIDPQQRLMLESTWRALESANIAPDSLGGSATGVFVGVSWNDYNRLQRDFVEKWDGYSGTGSTSLGVVANRISYCLGLQGPSFSVDTACSSALVALHQACVSLASSESRLAIVGGVNVLLSEDYGKILVQAKMLSPTGRCWSFDERGDGYVRSEGCGVVVLKRLSNAVRDGDRVLAVIRGSAVNQDGRSEGLSAPNGAAQRMVIRSALQCSGFDPSSIGYVEAHGTGTPLGDPTEIGALRAVLGDGDAESQPCFLGAVKSRIGHTEPAAGMAGLIKAVLVLQHGVIPPNGGFQKLNPRIDFNGSRFRLPLEPVQWPAPADHARRAGVTAYGFGGTNSHVVLEQFDAASIRPLPEQNQPRAEEDSHPVLLTLSARSETSLRALAGRYAELLQATARNKDREAICRTANTARARLPERIALAAADPVEMHAALDRFAAGDDAASAGMTRGWIGKKPRIAFLFTGQGSQYLGMGRALYRSEPVFKRHMDLCDAILKPHIHASILDVMFGDDAALLEDTRMAQPALVTLELSLVELWRHWGVEPEFLVGHSIGEAAAACVAGIMDLETVLRIVAERGRLMAGAPGKGAMLSVKAGAGVIAAALGELSDSIDVAGMNAPDQVVLAGPVEAIDAVQAILENRGLELTRLKVHNAFHSRLMDPVLPEFQSVFAGVQFREPALKIIPTGGEPDDNMTDASYWVHQLRCPVRFTEAMERLAAQGADTFIEIGPAPVLTGLGKRTIGQGLWLASLRAKRDDRVQIRSALGELFATGVEVDLARLDDHRPLPLVRVPQYPFDRAEYWFIHRDGTRRSAHAARRGKGSAPLLGNRIDVAVEGIDLVCFEASLPTEAEAYLLDHRVHGRSIMPAAGYLHMALAGARLAKLAPLNSALTLRDFQFHRPLDLSDGEVRVQTVLQRQTGVAAGGNEWQVRVMAWNAASERWEPYASGCLERSSSPAPTHGLVHGEAGSSQAQEIPQFYARCAEYGLQYGERFQALTRLQGGGAEVRGDIVLPDGVADATPGSLHPVILDAAFQILAGAVLGKDAAKRVALPFGVEALTIHRECRGRIFAEGLLRELPGGGGWMADLLLKNEQGDVVADISGLSLIWVDAATILRSRELPVQSFDVEWIAQAAQAKQHVDAQRPWIVLHEGGEAASALQAQGLTTVDGGLLGDASQASLSALIARQQAPAGIVLLLDGAGGADNDDAAHPAAACIALCQSVQRLLLAVQDLPGPTGLPDDARIWLVTRGAESVQPGDGPIDIAQAGLAGMLRSAAMEYPKFSPAQIDLPLMPAAADWQALAGLLGGSDESQCAVRQGAVTAPRLRALAAPQDKPMPALRPDAAYVITGGTGGLGMALAQWLADAGAQHLVLVGRRAAPTADVAARISALGEQGVRVKLARADVGDPADVARLFAELHADGLPVRGVFHAAGVLDDKPLAGIDAASWRNVIDAKARAACLLDRATQDIELDFFVVFSSVASVLGAAGQCNYAAANAVLDALVLARRRRGAVGLSVNWGAWAEVGMASDPALEAMFLQQGIPPMKPAAALRALGDALARRDAQAVVLAVDWKAFGANRLTTGAVPSALRSVVRRESAVRAPALHLMTPAELAALPSGEAAQAILRGLGSLVGEVMRIDIQRQFPDQQRLADTNLPALGVDSLMTMELRNRIRAWTGVDISAALLIGGAPLSQLVELIQQKLPSASHDTVSLPMVVEDLAQRHQPFPLTDLQYAYVIGRDAAFSAGRVSAHTYYEFDSDALDLPRLERALQVLIERHDMLRAIVLPDGRQQILQEAPRYRINQLDLRGTNADALAVQLAQLRAQLSHAVRPVDQWPLFDIRATRLDERRVRLHVGMDLLFADVWSYRLMLREWMTLYADPKTELPALHLSFRDYVLAEAQIEATPRYMQAREYWLERIAHLPLAPELPLAMPPEQLGQPCFVRRNARLPADQWRRIKERATGAGLTPSIVLLAAFARTLASWSKQARFTLDLTLFNRMPLHPQVNDIMGELTSVQLLELDLTQSPGLMQVAANAQKQLWQDLEHRYFSGVRVLRELARARGRAAALMPVVFTSALGQGGADAEDIPVQWLGEQVYGISQTPQVWLDHQVFENHGELMFNWDVIEALFPAGMMDDMFAAYCRLLQQLAQDDAAWEATWEAGAAAPALPAWQQEERRQANATEQAVPVELLHSAFDRQALRRPDAVAVIDQDGQHTYRELSERAWRLARRLHEAGVQRNELVVVSLEKGWMQVAAVIGILRAGAAYLPVVPDLPAPRRALLAEQGRARFAVTRQLPSAAAGWPENVQVIALDDDAIPDAIRQGDASPLDLTIDPERLAYVIFTSGSTGMPKGVMTDHRGANNTVQDINRRFQVDENDKVLAISGLGFDLSVYDIFGVLGAGGAIVMPSQERVVDPAHWNELVERHGVTIWNSVPQLLQVWADYLQAEHLQEDMPRLALLSGDWIPVQLPDQIRALCPGIEVVSLGGATEASIWSVWYPIGEVQPEWTSIPYGKPLANQTLHVYNDLLEPCPVWTAGEIYIGGIGVAQGYWGDAEKTAERFIVHPQSGERLYKTGDLGRYLPGGDIEFLGREDHQVKINGYRIELGEIAACLRKQPGIREALVTVAVNPITNSKQLVAYLVPVAPERVEQFAPALLSDALSRQLPEYMVPPHYMVLSEFPLSANGKVDLKALPALDLTGAEHVLTRVLPRNETEEQLAAIWSEVLGIPQVGVDDHFAVMGGDSLQAMRVVSRIRAEFRIDLPLIRFYEAPTVSGLAQYVEAVDWAAQGGLADDRQEREMGVL